jgi:hypothetical protein
MHHTLRKRGNMTETLTKFQTQELLDRLAKDYGISIIDLRDARRAGEVVKDDGVRIVYTRTTYGKSSWDINVKMHDDSEQPVFLRIEETLDEGYAVSYVPMSVPAPSTPAPTA